MAPVTVDGHGRRRVQVEVEVAGAPEVVWAAIATAEGISSWFVPTRITAASGGAPTQIVSDFGPGMRSDAVVTRWEPPRRFATRSNDLGDEAPPVETEWSVEDLATGRCRVRVAHWLETDAATWDAGLEAWEEGWPEFFVLLSLSCEHFAGQHAAVVSAVRAVGAQPPVAWSTIADALGLTARVAGAAVTSTAGAPAFAGTVVTYRLPHEAVVRLAHPAPGYAHLFTMPAEGGAIASVRLYLMGPGSSALAGAVGPRWEAWLEGLFGR